MSGKAASMPMGRPCRSRRQGLWRLLILLVILFIIGCYVSPVRSYIERSRQIESERAMTEALRIEHESLVRERDSLQDRQYLEQIARQDLGLVKPGEQSYVVKDLDSEARSASEPAVAEPPAAAAAAPDLLPLIP